MGSLRLLLACGDFAPRSRLERSQMTAVKQMICATANIRAVTNMLFIFNPYARCIRRFKIPKRLVVRQSLEWGQSSSCCSRALHTWFPGVAFGPGGPGKRGVKEEEIHTQKSQRRFQYPRRSCSSVESRSLAAQAEIEKSCGKVRREKSSRFVFHLPR